MLKKIMLLLVAVISMFTFSPEADAKILASYDLSRNAVTNHIPQPTDIFNFGIVSPRNFTVHRGDLRQYLEAQCLARDEFVLVSINDMPAIRKALSKYYRIESRGFYSFLGDQRLIRFAARYGLKNTIRVNFYSK